MHHRATSVEERIQRLEQKTNLISEEIKHLWKEALNAPIDVEATWLHGDLHSRNVLVENGVITGIIDWGDITAGDKATDLAAIWMLFLMGIYLMQTGEVQANLVTLNRHFQLPQITDLIACKLAGVEKSAIADSDLAFYEQDLLVRVRLAKEIPSGEEKN